jgi:hypothetical protein
MQAVAGKPEWRDGDAARSYRALLGGGLRQLRAGASLAQGAAAGQLQALQGLVARAVQASRRALVVS